MVNKKFILSFVISFVVFAAAAVLLIVGIMGNRVEPYDPNVTPTVAPSTPTTKPDDIEQRTKTLDLTLSEVEQEQGEGWAWDVDTKTLTLNGIDMNIQEGYGIKLPAGSTINIMDGSVNALNVYGYAIHCDGNLTLRGTGSLKVTTSDKTPVTAQGDIGIIGCNLSLNTSSFYALRTDGILAISGGKITANSTASAIVYSTLSFPEAQPTVMAGDFETNASELSDMGYLSAYKYVSFDFTPKPTDVPALPERLNILVTVPDEGNLRTDSIIILSADTKNGKLNITSIPRDLCVDIGTRKDKINTCTVYKDFQYLIDTIEHVSGMDIHYYAILRISGVRNVVDLLGGVEFDVPQDMKYRDPDQNLYINLKKGYQLLDGDKTEQLLRFRRYVLGDIKRTEVQRNFLKEMFTQKVTAENIAKAPDLLAEIFDNVRTNISMADVLANINILKVMVGDNIQTLAVPGYDEYVDGKSYYFFHEEKAYAFFAENFGGIGMAFDDGSNDVLPEHNLSHGNRD